MSREAEDAAIAFLLRLDPATQREVLERFDEVMQDEPLSESRRLRRVAAALYQAKRSLDGRSPSLREYKRLRHEHPEWGCPDPRSVTRWLGVRGWNEALVRMRLEPVLDGDLIERGVGPTYSIDEVIQAVRNCAADLGRPPTITDYLAWQRRPDVRDRPGRRPACTWVFNRIFGGFPAARVAAGLASGEPTDAHPSDFFLRTANYRIKDEQILEDLRFAAERIDGPVTATSYDRERRLVYQETLPAGRRRALAGVGTIYRHFRSWLAALDAAGIDVRERPAGGARHPVFSREQLLRALSDAYDAIDGRFTMVTYTDWREHELEREPADNAALPSPVTIWRRFSGWRNALAEMHEWRRATGKREPAPTARAVDSDRQQSVGLLGRPRPLYGNERLLGALSQAQEAVGGAPTMRAYRAWREQEARSNPSGPFAPGHLTIWKRFGGWPNAIDQMHEWRRRR